MTITARVWSAQHTNAGQNIQQNNFKRKIFNEKFTVRNWFK